ncbi:unnamed protein product [Rotaria socialis]|nr:unnamed protein product [Rotaria socialis]CAF4456565.1 unnamed protein product [Rotaria socialis]CAF4535984.1 unnamed protein product [Rotaria socialis]
MSAIQPFHPELGTPEMLDILAIYLAASHTSVDPTISMSRQIFVTNYGYTLENETIGKTINICLKYQSWNQYIATAQIGWEVFESIIENGCKHESSKSSFLYMSSVMDCFID